MIFHRKLIDTRHQKTLYLTYGFSHQTAHHHARCADEQVSLGLCGPAQSHLLETQLTVHYSSHILSLGGKTQTPFLNKSDKTCTVLLTEVMINTLRKKLKVQTFLIAYFGSSGITRRIFPSQYSATTRSFFQPWKQNTEGMMMMMMMKLPANSSEQTHLPVKQTEPAASTRDVQETREYFQQK